MPLDPTIPVWLSTLHEPAHRPTTNGRTRCGLPATTAANRTATGISTVAQFADSLCPKCWPDVSPNPSTKEHR